MPSKNIILPRHMFIITTLSWYYHNTCPQKHSVPMKHNEKTYYYGIKKIYF